MGDSRNLAFGLATVLAEHKALDVTVLDVGETAGWTDYFVLATCTSVSHMRGLLRFMDEKIAAEDAARLNRPDVGEEQNWLLVDLGDVVVHVMTAEARAFYELERLWFKAPAFPVTAGPPSATPIPGEPGAAE